MTEWQDRVVETSLEMQVKELRQDNAEMRELLNVLAEGAQPHLGLATTRELLDELRARFEMHALGGLDYRTVDGEKFAQETGPRVQP